MPAWIPDHDAARFHRIVKMLEADLNEAYFSVRTVFGADVAGAVLIALMRQRLNDKPNQWPPPESLETKVNDFLREKGLMQDESHEGYEQYNPGSSVEYP